MKLGLMLALTLAAIDCKTVNTPDAGQADSGVIQIPVTPVCQLLEGITDNGTVATICATAEEILQVVAFITTLRTGVDAGSPACAYLPGTTFCATKQETAKGIAYLVRARQARLLLDAGPEAGK